MNVIEIQRQVKFINNSEGRPVEVILPYEVYQEPLRLQISMEIYHQNDTQESIQRAKNDIKEGKTISFKNIDRASEWLDR